MKQINQQHECPFCKLVVIFNYEHLTTLHQAPLCNNWDKLVRSHGANPVSGFINL